MTINFDDTLQGIYYLSGDKQDWLAGVNLLADGKITLTYRFRYYSGDSSKSAFEDGDRKRWYSGTLKSGDVEVALATMRKLMDEMQSAGYVPKGGMAYRLERKGSMTTEQMANAYERLPFVHKKEMSKEEYEKEYGEWPPGKFPNWYSLNI